MYLCRTHALMRKVIVCSLVVIFSILLFDSLLSNSPVTFQSFAVAYSTSRHAEPSLLSPIAHLCNTKYNYWLSECYNGGEPENDNSQREYYYYEEEEEEREEKPCVCPLYYTGEDCAQRQCPHSMNGDGINKIAPVNPINQFCDQCNESAYQGLNCQLCQSNAACNSYDADGETNFTCNHSLVIHGSSKQFQCGLNAPEFLRLMGDDRNISAQVILNCTTEDGEAFRGNDNGVCHMAIYRIEPENEYVDPFFRCDTTSCSMKRGEIVNEKDVANFKKAAFHIIRLCGQIWLVLLCVALTLLGLFAPYVGRKRMRQYTFTLASALALSAVGYVVFMIIGIHSNGTTPTVIYECKHTHCACAEDPPPEYTPICSQSDILARGILPSIQNAIRVQCELTSDACQLTLADLSLVFDVNCNATECVNEEAFPYWPPNDEDNNEFHPSQLLIAGLFTLVVLCCVGVVAHWLYTRWKSEKLAKEFVIRFQLPSHTSNDGPSPSSHNNNHNHHHHHHHPNNNNNMYAASRLYSSSSYVANNNNNNNNVGNNEETAPLLPHLSSSSLHSSSSELIISPSSTNTSISSENNNNNNNNNNVVNEDESSGRTMPHDLHLTNKTNKIVDLHPVNHDSTNSLHEQEELQEERKRENNLKQLQTKITEQMSLLSHNNNNINNKNINNNKNDASTSNRESCSAFSIHESTLQRAINQTEVERTEAQYVRELTSADLELRAMNLQYTINGSFFAESDEAASKVILHAVNFAVRSGEVLAIMGPSGAGKTTLLDLLSARAKSGMVQGIVALNGTPITTQSRDHRSLLHTSWQHFTSHDYDANSGNEFNPEPSMIESSNNNNHNNNNNSNTRGVKPFRKVCATMVAHAKSCVRQCISAEMPFNEVSEYNSIIGYVSQEDTLLPALTVHQTIEYAARLKLPRAFSSKTIHKIVHQVIHWLRLEQCAHVLIGDGATIRGISGGEKRRVSIAVELLANPRILFLDEPTSGLDTISAVHVMEAVVALGKNSPLKKYAPHYFAFQPIVIFSIHQPSLEIYNMFDKVLLLSRGVGVYCGPANHAAITLERRVNEAFNHTRHLPRSIDYANPAEYLMKLEEVLDDGVRMELLDASMAHLESPLQVIQLPNSNTTNTNNTNNNNTVFSSSSLTESLFSPSPIPSRSPINQNVHADIGQNNNNNNNNNRRRRSLESSPITPQRSQSLLVRRNTTMPNNNNNDTNYMVHQDEQVHENGNHINLLASLSSERQLYLPSDTKHLIVRDGASILKVTAEFHKYYANVYEQLALLTSRSTSCLITSFHLVVCHAAVVACLASLMCFLYPEQQLDLPGALNRAGSVSFLLLVTSFVSLSCLEQLIIERKLFVLERENGFYSTFPYLLSKVAVDIIPLRIIPAVVLTSVIYFPMGFRADIGMHFFWFVLIIVLFSVSITLMIMCIGVVSGTFGAAALLSSVFILWNFVFGGSLVQAETIPWYLRPFKSVSPFFLAFESLMVNELDGQACVFSPTDETGKPSSASIPIMCVQYLANVGLKPARFNTDVMQLALYCFVFLLFAWLLLSTCSKIVR